MKLFSRFRRPPLKIPVAELRFLREQDGKPEQLLKSRLAESFQRNPSVQRAYLALISSGGQVSVALCLKARAGPDSNIVREAGDAFSTVFAKQQHLDILFLSEAQESALSEVCSPFYAVASRA